MDWSTIPWADLGIGGISVLVLGRLLHERLQESRWKKSNGNGNGRPSSGTPPADSELVRETWRATDETLRLAKSTEDRLGKVVERLDGIQLNTQETAHWMRKLARRQLGEDDGD